MKFCQLNFYQNVPTFLEVKIDIIQVTYFDTLPSLLSLLNAALGASKDGHFSFFQMSCQLGLILYGMGCEKKKQ